MTNNQQYDAAHFSFLELIRVLTDIVGPGAAKVSLIKLAKEAAQQVSKKEFADMEEFIKSIEGMDNPISQFEGKAEYHGDGLFGLPQCPFAPAIKNYQKMKPEMPAEFGLVTDTLNRPTEQTKQLRVFEGAAVSPFCGVHQPIRSAMGSTIKVGGYSLEVYQLGCKSGAGKISCADERINGLEIDRKKVEDVLADNMCCYYIKLVSDEECIEVK